MSRSVAGRGTGSPGAAGVLERSTQGRSRRRRRGDIARCSVGSSAAASARGHLTSRGGRCKLRAALSGETSPRVRALKTWAFAVVPVRKGRRAGGARGRDPPGRHRRRLGGRPGLRHRAGAAGGPRRLRAQVARPARPHALRPQAGDPRARGAPRTSTRFPRRVEVSVHGGHLPSLADSAQGRGAACSAR